MLVAIGGIKGGSGKTTISTNLAVLRSQTHKILLVDADEQGSTYDWSEQRELKGIPTRWSTVKIPGLNIANQLRRQKDSYDDVIVDVGGRNTQEQRAALVCADVFIVPFRPRSLDIWTLGTVKNLMNESMGYNSNLKCYVLINQADCLGKDNKEAMEVLDNCEGITCIPHFIYNRKAFANAASEGLGVVELKKEDPKASQEIKDLYSYVFDVESK